VSGWLQALVAVASVLFGGGGLAVLVAAFTGRKQRKAEVADRLSDTTLKWVQEFQEEAARSHTEAQSSRIEAADARREMAEMRRELAEVRRELAAVREEALAFARDLRDLRGAIMRPDATIERLRALVGGEANGRY
jgi:transposase-like protein